jgi:hypothetical protein
MTTLTATQIVVGLFANGWFDYTKDPDNAAIATAIALAESGGKTNAISLTQDYGLFQINKPAHPDLFAKYKNWDWPSQNILMAKQVYQNAGNKFTPWSTYKSGAYKSHLKAAQTAIANLILESTGHAVGQYIIPRDDSHNAPHLYPENVEAVIKNPGGNAVSRTAGDVINALNPANWLAWLANAFVTAGVFIAAVVLFIVGVWLLIPKDQLPKLPAVI